MRTFNIYSLSNFQNYNIVLMTIWSREWQHAALFLRKIPWVEEPGQLYSMALQRSGHNWHIPRRREHSFFLYQWPQSPCCMLHPQDLFLPFDPLQPSPGPLTSGSCPSALCVCQSSSVSQSCPTLRNPMDCSTPGFPVLCSFQIPELTQTHVRWVVSIQPSHPLSSLSPPTFILSQHQGLFSRVSSSHQVDKVLEFQLQHQSFQWILRIDFFQNGLVGSPCSPRDSQESSPTPQFKSINSLALSFLSSPTLSSIHDHWKNHSLD